VDDEPLNVDLLEQELGDLGYVTDSAYGGKEALEKVTAGRPDLILLDVMMPDLDGITVCRMLKEDRATHLIPIVIMTALNATEDRVRGIEAGADDFLTKPVDDRELHARIVTLLKTKRVVDQTIDELQSVSTQLARMESELNIGREIQMSLLPHEFPDDSRISIHADLLPAREVGGDWYDFFFIDEDQLCFSIGDVAGKGVPGALFMAVVKTLIKSRAALDHSTASIIERINQELSKDNRSMMFATIFIGILNARTGELLYTNAAHNPPYRLSVDGELERLDSRHGVIVGPIKSSQYAEQKTVLANGDLLVLYTDGVTEAMNPSEEMFSEDRLVQLLSSAEFRPADEIIASIFSEVRQFASGAEQSDDITALAIQFR